MVKCGQWVNLLEWGTCCLLVVSADDLCLRALVRPWNYHRLKLATASPTVCKHNNRNRYIAQLEVVQSKRLTTFYLYGCIVPVLAANSSLVDVHLEAAVGQNACLFAHCKLLCRNVCLAGKYVEGMTAECQPHSLPHPQQQVCEQII